MGKDSTYGSATGGLTASVREGSAWDSARCTRHPSLVLCQCPQNWFYCRGCERGRGSIDQASNLGEQINPFNESLTRVIASWDMTHNFVATWLASPRKV
jgi:hypothetical protein